MAGDASNSFGGGTADRTGRETGRAEAKGGGDDPWRRIETEQAERDRASRAHDAAHDPSEVFEKSHLSLPERDRSPGRFTVDDFTPEQRAELEEAHERPLEEILASRDRAYEAEQARRAEAPPPQELEGYPDLPADDTANEIVRHYRDGHFTYDSATRRLELLGHQPKPIQQQDQPDQAEQADQQDQQDQQPTTAPDVQAPTDQHGKLDQRGEPDELGDTNQRGEPDQPGEADIDTGDSASPQPASDPAERLSQIANDLRAGNLTPDQAADQLEQLHPAADQSVEPEDGREPETHGTVPHDELTTELVRKEDGLRLEKGAPEGISEDFVLESDEQSRIDRLGNRVSDRSFVEGVQEVGSGYVQRTLDAWANRVKPTGTSVGIPDDHPVLREKQPDAAKLQGAELMIAPVVLYLLGHHGVRSAMRVLNKKQAKGSADDDRSH